MVSSRFWSWLTDCFGTLLTLPLPQDDGQGVPNMLVLALIGFGLTLVFAALRAIFGEFFEGFFDNSDDDTDNFDFTHGRFKS